jgi:hypothetical protein
VDDILNSWGFMEQSMVIWKVKCLHGFNTLKGTSLQWKAIGANNGCWNDLEIRMKEGSKKLPDDGRLLPKHVAIHPCMALQPLPGLGLPRASTRPCFQLFSSILLLPAAVMHPSEPHLPIWFLVFPLVLCCGRFHLRPFHSYYMARLP